MSWLGVPDSSSPQPARAQCPTGGRGPRLGPNKPLQRPGVRPISIGVLVPVHTSRIGREDGAEAEAHTVGQEAPLPCATTRTSPTRPSQPTGRDNSDRVDFFSETFDVWENGSEVYPRENVVLCRRLSVAADEMLVVPPCGRLSIPLARREQEGFHVGSKPASVDRYLARVRRGPVVLLLGEPKNPYVHSCRAPHLRRLRGDRHGVAGVAALLA